MEEQKNTTSEEVKKVIDGKKAESSDVEKNKAMAIIGYIIPILFFIPLLSDDSKKSPFAKFHANQQLIILIFSLIGFTVASVLVIILIGFLLYIIVWIAVIVFIIMGVINASNGEMKKLPIIGDFEIIK